MMLPSALSALLLAATVVPQTVEQLTDRATTVVRATVGERVSREEVGPAGIATYSELNVEEVLKGQAAPTVRVRQSGGIVGRRRVDLPGDAVLASGEQVLVFLKCVAGRDACSLIGLAQGKFHLEPGSDGALRATRDFAQTEFVRGPPPEAGPLAYGELARRVRAQVGATR